MRRVLARSYASLRVNELLNWQVAAADRISIADASATKVYGSEQLQRLGEDYAEIVVPRGTVFVLCDNRSASKSLDSRTLGPIGAWAIVGKLR